MVARSRRVLDVAVLVGSVAALCVVSSPLTSPDPARAATLDERPNVVLIVTDDQRWDTLWAMPNVEALLADRGVTFTNAVASNPLCCPSRASILTGTYSHTNDVWRNDPPHGGFASFDDSSTIAARLHEAGYRTGLFGKYLNGYWGTGSASYVPPGWDRWYAFNKPAFYNYDVSDDGSEVRYGTAPEDYSTDQLATQLLTFISSGEQPFFVYFAPYAPHQPATPAPGDEDAFADVELPSSDAINERNVSDKPAWVRSLPRLKDADLRELRLEFRESLRSLLAVDRVVLAITEALAERGELHNTLFIYMSDNGLAFGEHRWNSKRAPYEESIRVPLVIRYDPITSGAATTSALVANVDITPTIAELTGLGDQSADGLSLVPSLLDPTWTPPRDGIPLEHLARADDAVPSYCGYRTPKVTYVRYAGGDEELYNLRRDPSQRANLADSQRAGDRLDLLREHSRHACGGGPPDRAFTWSDVT